MPGQPGAAPDRRATYFDRLVDEVEALEPGDHLLFTDWRGDADECMRPEGPAIAALFGDAARRGVIVKGLMWRSHTDKASYSEEENHRLGAEASDAGGEVLLDQRVRRAGSHHQKLVVLRHPEHPERDVAFAGGIDLCRSRRDDAEHTGDPQALPMSRCYSPNPSWHDAQLELRGPVVGALDTVFRERWNDPTSLDVHNPIARLRDALRGADLTPDPLPAQPPDPSEAGPHTVQVLRTYPAIRLPYSFAPQGERSVARGFAKALRRARRLIYLEDQYMWSPHIARLLAEALRRNPQLHMIVVVPRHPDVDGALALPPNLVGRVQAIELCRKAAPDRVHVFDLENHEGEAVYVHAKVAVLDDVWASVGSANLNRRSWSHDSELTCAVLDTERDEREPTDPAGLGDGARTFARDLRLALMREHLDRRPDDDDDLLDPDSAVRAVTAAAAALDDWYATGRRGPRPPGRLSTHQPERLSRLTRLWAVPVYRLIYDPDGRPWRARLRHRW
ncbi:phospholipase D family protein [Pseudonocardia bannensis]|uniref:phospholipase D family protein n=1 Tax=Pseudonocardia bannensis TaxID=630973 RepID=UPI001B7D114F|nr:phospholipase D family protein [Pseudonocardia bannensis]